MISGIATETCRQKLAPPREKLTNFGKKIRITVRFVFKKRGRFWRACFGSGHRALAVSVPDGYLWFWIGTHDEYERLLRDL